MTTTLGRTFRLGLALLGPSLGAHAAPAGHESGVVPGGKPIAPIAIDYTIDVEPALGQALGIRVTIVPEQRLDDVAVTLMPSDGLVLGGTPTQTSHGAVAAGQRIELELSVTPLVLARLRLGVTVAGDLDGVPQARTVSIPIRLADTLERSAAELKLDASGEVLHALPAHRPPRGSRR